MSPRPPESTLFPYTTLFRSTAVADTATRRVRAVEPDHAAVEHVRADVQQHVVRQVDRLERDRKSTRLNSSHPSISYAVFCLKKKKSWYSPTISMALLTRSAT